MLIIYIPQGLSDSLCSLSSLTRAMRILMTMKQRSVELQHLLGRGSGEKVHKCTSYIAHRLTKVSDVICAVDLDLFKHNSTLRMIA